MSRYKVEFFGVLCVAFLVWGTLGLIDGMNRAVLEAEEKYSGILYTVTHNENEYKDLRYKYRGYPDSGSQGTMFITPEGKLIVFIDKCLIEEQ